jgi:hypothetical protein
MFKTFIAFSALALTLAGGILAAKADNDTFTSNKGGYFVFVPLPCPSDAAYKDTEAFMDKIVQRAETEHFKVIVVRSCYNDVANLQKSKDNNWWWDAIQDLPQHYKFFIDAGLVEVVDTYPDANVDYTPKGYFYRNGKVEWNGQLNDSNSDFVLRGVVAPGA